MSGRGNFKNLFNQWEHMYNREKVNNNLSLTNDNDGSVVNLNMVQLESDAYYINWFNELLNDDSVNDVMVNRFDRIFVERSGNLIQIDFNLGSEQVVRMLADYLIRLTNRGDIGDSQRFDGMLPSGNRLSILLPPAAVDGPSIAIRRIKDNPYTLDVMVEQNLMPANVAAFLKALAKARVNIMISGSTSSGKTTLLNALSAHINKQERILTVEDTAELRLQHKNVVRMEANEGHGGVTQRDLVKCCLRMRGDRIIMGEIRGIEAFDFLQAINTGHEGSMATIHANNPRDALMRLEMMINMSGNNLSGRFIHQQIASSLNILIQTIRNEQGKRRISHITEIVGLEGDTIISQDLFIYQEDSKTGKGGYKWSNYGSRNPKVQEAIFEAGLIARRS